MIAAYKLTKPMGCNAWVLR